jgi:flagellar biosynthetic protein FlhB
VPEKPFQEKTEPASPKRREEARKKGQVAKSKEVVSVSVLAAGVIFFYFAGEHLASRMGAMIRSAFLSIPDFATHDFNLFTFLQKTVLGGLMSVVPFMVTIAVVAILANYLQVGVVWSVGPLAPKASKISPMEGAKRIFSKRSLVELAKSLGKIIIVGWAAFSVMNDEIGRLAQLIYQDNVQIMRYLGETAFKVMTRSCYVIAVLALLDYLYQRWEFEQNMRMTKQEVKEEFKQTEGDPLVKARIRSIQRQMARRRMMEEVKKADVIITNPTHISIALRYDAATMAAPKVVAKGAEELAFRIREVAQAHGVPLVENKGLAQNLYKSVDIGGEIPSELYRAVAEILAYVYGLKGRSV